MNQSKLGSVYEALVNIVIGFSINWVCNLLILPLFGYHVSGGQAFKIGLLFTGVSIARQYVIRRWFNGSAARLGARLAKDAA